MEYVTLNNGVKMPMVGFGVFQVNDMNRSAAHDDQDPANTRWIVTMKIHD